MLTIYIACLVFGAVLVTMSLFAGGDADHGGFDHADAGHALGAHGGIDHGMDAPNDLHVGAPQDMHALPPDHGDAVAPIDTHAGDMQVTHSAGDHVQTGQEHLTAEAARFLSFRNGVYFMAFFGLTGTVLTMLSIPGIIAFLSSVGLGMFSAYTGYRFMGYLSRTQSGQPVNLFDLQGRLAEVSLTVSRKQPGKIVLETGGQRHQLIARTAEESSKGTFHGGDHVIISRIENGVAFVIESDRLIS